MYKLWRKFLAVFRLDLNAVCEESVGMSEHADYHDYPDDISGAPTHRRKMECRRCGKAFTI
jgi:hypothetical protein